MTALISTTDAEKLTRPHIARAWFVELDMPDGLLRLHNGVGRVTVAGQEWRGVSDPLGGRLVQIGQVEQPSPGKAASISLTLTGATSTFMKSVWTSRRAIEGRSAVVHFAVFDQETQELIMGPIALFPHGTMTSPVLQRSGLAVRSVSLTVESMWAALNYAPGGRWTDADQRRRYPGDLGLEFCGHKFREQWTG